MGDFIRILDVVEKRDARFCERVLREAGITPDTTEVLLSRKGLLENCNMKHLLCLEALWLNDNKLTRIEGLDTNVQIKALYLHNNKIATLEGSLKHLRHIMTLSLFNNRLQDLEATLPLIHHLTRLEELDLSGNPLANEVNYRLRVIHTFHSLKVLDKHEVTEAERIEAQVLFEGRKVINICFASTKPRWKNPPKQKIASLSKTTKDMYREIDRYKEQLERERAAQQLAETASLSRPSSRWGTGGKPPLASAVEAVTMNCKTLKDVLGDDYGGATRAERRAAGGLGKSGDYFQMKRFILGKVPVSLEETVPLGHASRGTSRASSSHSRRSTKSPSKDTIVLDQERYHKYETMKGNTKTSNELHDWMEWI